MAVGDITPYQKWSKAQADSSSLSSMPVDFDTDTLKVIILDDTFVPDTTASTIQEHLDDVSADEVITTGTVYTGPVTLAGKTVALAAGVVTFDATDIALAADVGGGFTNGRYIVFYKDSGAEATSPLIAVGDLGANRDLTAGSLDFNWAGTGIITWTQ